MNNFTNKEILLRILDKLDSMDERLNETHELARMTNGKVRLHTKFIYGLAGLFFSTFLTLVGWIIKISI